MRPASKCHFFLGLQSGNPEIPKVRPPANLGAHNFVCEPSNEMRLKKSCMPHGGFLMVCGTPPACKEIWAIPDF